MTTTDLSPLVSLLEEDRQDPHGGNLISLLQKTQALYGYLPREALSSISQALGIKLPKVLGVATFYTQFRMAPAGKYMIQLCHGTACHVNGAEEIGVALKEHLAISDGETTSDGLFTLQQVACLGCCSLSPVMTINGTPYGLLTPDMAAQIVSDIKHAEEPS